MAQNNFIKVPTSIVETFLFEEQKEVLGLDVKDGFFAYAVQDQNISEIVIKTSDNEFHWSHPDCKDGSTGIFNLRVLSSNEILLSFENVFETPTFIFDGMGNLIRSFDLGFEAQDIFVIGENKMIVSYSEEALCSKHTHTNSNDFSLIGSKSGIVIFDFNGQALVKWSGTSKQAGEWTKSMDEACDPNCYSSNGEFIFAINSYAGHSSITGMNRFLSFDTNTQNTFVLPKVDSSLYPDQMDENSVRHFSWGSVTDTDWLGIRYDSVFYYAINRNNVQVLTKDFKQLDKILFEGEYFAKGVVTDAQFCLKNDKCYYLCKIV